MQTLVVNLTADGSSGGKASPRSISKGLPSTDSRPTSARIGSAAALRTGAPSIAVLRA